MHKFFFYNKTFICLYMFRAPCAHHQEVKTVLYSIWYHYTETSEWSKINKIQFYKYEHIVVKICVWIFRLWLITKIILQIYTSLQSFTYVQTWIFIISANPV